MDPENQGQIPSIVTPNRIVGTHDLTNAIYFKGKFCSFPKEQLDLTAFTSRMGTKVVPMMQVLVYMIRTGRKIEAAVSSTRVSGTTYSFFRQRPSQSKSDEDSVTDTDYKRVIST
jgi:hypothetical protein